MLSKVLSVPAVVAIASIVSVARAVDLSCNDNVAVYWGQNSYGATNAADRANWQKRLAHYCRDDAIDVIPLAFMTTSYGVGGLPEINLADACNNNDNGTFPGTNLADCGRLADDIEYCQSKGKTILLSMGGATGNAGFEDANQASEFATTAWNMFLGGTHQYRPFGKASLDGIDLDIESPHNPELWEVFTERLRQHFNETNRQYVISAAPQCVFPDAALGTWLNHAWVDMVFVQFYNNFCGLNAYGDAKQWNFGDWAVWAKTRSKNDKVRVFIGAPASATAAGTGYLDIAKLQNAATETARSFSSFGGIMLWDASQAEANNGYAQAIKQTLKSNSSCGSTSTLANCTADAWTAGNNYQAGARVAHTGFVWEAKWSASSEPGNASGEQSEWMAVQECT
ncbi:hypothetical protein BZG36_01538 [Bifiguratus adelaidae]|uniref:chitinase n=1 Tax=Bifiguratus adelaidae TaxID=1938954 RepID=A0A261Y431_9FUNG|nr:hypothetical protein BZG36_01538 [Bifiguratus adelaidae]